MKTLAVISRKGGAGKTTLSVNLAITAHLAGLKTMIADIDTPHASHSHATARAALHTITHINGLRSEQQNRWRSKRNESKEKKRTNKQTDENMRPYNKALGRRVKGQHKRRI